MSTHSRKRRSAIVIASIAVFLISAFLAVRALVPGAMLDALGPALNRDREGGSVPALTAVSGGIDFNAHMAGLEAPALIVFWSPGCGYCHRLQSFLTEWERRNGVVLPVVLVSFNPDADFNESQRPEAGRHWISFSVVGDAGGIRDFRTSHNLKAIPSLWMVDEDGIILREAHGFNILGVNRMAKRLSGVRAPQPWILFRSAWSGED